MNEQNGEMVKIIQCNLSAILRVFNSNHKVDTIKLDDLCKETYELKC